MSSGGEQYVRQWQQFRDVVSPHRNLQRTNFTEKMKVLCETWKDRYLLLQLSTTKPSLEQDESILHHHKIVKYSLNISFLSIAWWTFGFWRHGFNLVSLLLLFGLPSSGNRFVRIFNLLRACYMSGRSHVALLDNLRGSWATSVYPEK
jgi:hypothetical protein